MTFNAGWMPKVGMENSEPVSLEFADGELARGRRSAYKPKGHSL